MGAYEGKASTIKEAKEKTDGFKKGGAAKKMAGGYAEGGKSKKVMSKAERPARKSGGGVLSSASSGTPRGKASHY
jgi:hypothetical protein